MFLTRGKEKKEDKGTEKSRVEKRRHRRKRKSEVKGGKATEKRRGLCAHGWDGLYCTLGISPSPAIACIRRGWARKDTSTTSGSVKISPVSHECHS